MTPSLCPNCGCSTYPNDVGHCPDCNYPPLRRLILRGSNGQLSFGVRTRLGSSLLLKISPDAIYAERDEQFAVFCRDSDWFLVPRSATKNRTILNGKPVNGETRLNEHDVIAIGSAADSGKQVMQLVVGMVAS
jgi:hypothetical protein